MSDYKAMLINIQASEMRCLRPNNAKYSTRLISNNESIYRLRNQCMLLSYMLSFKYKSNNHARKLP